MVVSIEKLGRVGPARRDRQYQRNKHYVADHLARDLHLSDGSNLFCEIVVQYAPVRCGRVEHMFESLDLLALAGKFGRIVPREEDATHGVVDDMHQRYHRERFYWTGTMLYKSYRGINSELRFADEKPTSDAPSPEAGSSTRSPTKIPPRPSAG